MTSPSAINSATGLTTPAAGASQAASTPNPLATQDVFLQLLVAQLKNQDPESPADGTAFVTQLAQFSTLQEDTQSTTDLNAILQTVQTYAAAPPAATTPAAPATGATGSSSTTNP